MRLVFDHVVPLPRDEVFRFHTNPTNLARLLEGWRGFRMLRHEGSIRVGAEVWLEQRFAGFVPVVMGFRHVLDDPPRAFAEQLVHGPFDRFHHLHEFEDKRGGTRVRDVLDVRAKACFGGELGTRVLVAPFVRELFRFRHAALERIARGELLPRGP